MMKKSFKTMCISAAAVCCMSIPAFAAETKEEYRAEAETINQEMASVDDQIRALRQANNAVSAKYKEICAERRETGTTSISQDILDQIKALHAEASQYRVSKEDAPNNKELRADVRASVAGENYDEALATLGLLLENKQASLEKLEQASTIWQQIDALL